MSAIGIVIVLASGIVTYYTNSRLATFLLVGYFAIWFALKPNDDTRAKYFLASCFPIALGPSLLLVSGIRSIESANYDWLLRDADRLLFGFSPIYKQCPVMIRVPLDIIYLSLPAAVVVSLVWAIFRNDARPILASILFSILVAPVFYALLPAAGPAHGFRDIPNCIPSVHCSTGIILWYFNRKIGRPQSVASLLFGVLIGASTITTGEHYLIDLVAAVPFSILCINVGNLWSREERIGGFAAAR